jgi:hypothetical protein
MKTREREIAELLEAVYFDELEALCKLGYEPQLAYLLGERAPNLAKMRKLGGPDSPAREDHEGWGARREDLRALLEDVIANDLKTVLDERDREGARMLLRLDMRQPGQRPLQTVYDLIHDKLFFAEDVGPGHFKAIRKKPALEAIAKALAVREVQERMKAEKAAARKSKKRASASKPRSTRARPRKRAGRPAKSPQDAEATTEPRPQARPAPIPEPLPVPPPKPLPRRSPRRRPLIVAALAFLIALGVGALVAFSGGGASPKNGDPVKRVFDIQAAPDYLAAAAGFAWLADSHTETVTRIAADGSRTRYFLDHPPRVANLEGLGLQVGGYQPIPEAGGQASVVVNDGTVLAIGPGPHAMKHLTKLKRPAGAAALSKGSLWISVAPRSVVRFTRTGEFQRRYRLRGASVLPSTDTVAGLGSVWVLDDRRVYKLTPERGRARIAEAILPLHQRAVALAAGLGALWTVDANGTISHYDPATGGRGRPIRVPGGAKMIALSGNAIWVGTGKRTVVRIDPITQQVVGDPIHLPDRPVAIAADHDAVWVATARRLVEIDPS